MLTVSSSYVSSSYWQYAAAGKGSPSVPEAKGSPVRQSNGADPVSVSAEGKELSRRAGGAAAPGDTPNEGPSRPSAAGMTESLSAAKELQQLKSRDTEVRSHEQAHLAAAGRYARGGAAYTYQRGPDGKSYATGGEVPIDIGTERTPEATIAKMQIIKRAALAPANPSAADRQIAAQASAKLLQAQQQLSQDRGATPLATPYPGGQEKSVPDDGTIAGISPAAETFGQISSFKAQASATVDDLL